MKPGDLGALLLLSALWGGSFLFIRVAAPVLGPLALAEARVGLAGLALLLYAVTTRRLPDLRARWRPLLVIGVINSALPFALIMAAELRLSASLAAILNATSPLFGALVAATWLGEALPARKIAGLVLGATGVAVLVGGSPLPRDGATALAVGASLLAALCYGCAAAYTKARATGLPPLALAVGSQLGASLVLLPLVPLAPPRAWPSGGVALCVLALALLSTAVAYLLYFRLIVNVGPTRALTVTFLTPLFGVTWGVLFLREPVGPGTLLGGAIVLAGTALVTGLLPRPARVPASSVAPLAGE